MKETIENIRQQSILEIKNSKDDSEGTEIGWFNSFIVDENNNEQILMVNMVEDVKDRGGSHYVVPKVKDILEMVR